VGQSTTIAYHSKHSGWAFHSSAVMAKIQLPENPCQCVYGSHSELQPTNSSGKLKASIAGRGRNATYQLIWWHPAQTPTLNAECTFMKAESKGTPSPGSRSSYSTASVSFNVQYYSNIQDSLQTATHYPHVDVPDRHVNGEWLHTRSG
jgi:hypothetical protein